MIIHIGIEIETRKKFLAPIITNLYWIRFISWILNAALLTINILLFPAFQWLTLQILLASLSFTIMQLYTIYLYGQKHPKIWKQLQKIVGVAIYIEIFAVCVYLLTPQMLSLPAATQQLQILIYFLLITELVAIIYSLLLIDRYLIKWITHRMIKIIDMVIYILFIVLVVFDISFILYLTVDFTSVIDKITPAPPEGIIVQIPFQIVIPMLIFTILLAIGLYFKFKKRTLNQIMYAIISLEILVILAGFENYIAVLIAFLGFAGVFPFIFYFAQTIQVLIRIWRSFLHLLHNILLQFVAFFQQIWKNVVRITKAISRWVIRHIRLVVTIIALICAAVVFIVILILTNEYKIFTSGFIFFIILYPVSPQRQKETTQKNFSKKVLYWLAVSVFLFGTITELFGQITRFPWVISLYSLLILGYIIWVVRKSEELYNLSPYWRLGSSLAAIIDFLIMIALILNEFLDFIPFL